MKTKTQYLKPKATHSHRFKFLALLLCLFIPKTMKNEYKYICFRILIKAGLLLYGFNDVQSNEGDIGPPPLATNYIVALKKLESETDEMKNPIAAGTLAHATTAVLSLEKTDKEGIEESCKKILQSLIQQKAKNSPLYSRLVQVLWTSDPLMVFDN